MFNMVMSLLINTGAFYGISKVLPGFKIKSEQTAFTVAVVYSILGGMAGSLVAPLVGIVTIGLMLFAFIPVIGPLIAGAGLLATVFLVSFALTVLLLIGIDKYMEDFEMDSISTTFFAAILLGVINVVARVILPGV